MLPLTHLLNLWPSSPVACDAYPRGSFWVQEEALLRPLPEGNCVSGRELALLFPSWLYLLIEGGMIHLTGEIGHPPPQLYFSTW